MNTIATLPIAYLWAGLYEPIAYQLNTEEIAAIPAAQINEAEQFETPPAESIQSTKYQEEVFRWTQAEVAAAQPAYWFEIARFITPASALGIITRLWTHLYYYQPGANGDAIDMCLNDPACPWKHERFYLHEFGFKLRWRLQLETKRPIFDPVNPLYFRVESELPGMPFWELPTWTDQRYCWGNNSSNVRLIIPENSTLRLFVGLDGDCWNDDDCNGG